MKKLNLIAAFTILVSFLSSCSKEPLEYRSPYQVDKSFFFFMEMGRSIPASYGYIDLNNQTKWGPAMSIEQDNDPTKPSTTIKVNNKYGIPKEMQGDLQINFVLRKKGTDPVGRYDAMVTNGESAANIVDISTGRQYTIHKESLKFNVLVIGRSTLFGKYAEGNYTMNVVDVKDTAKQIPIRGDFRLHMME